MKRNRGRSIAWILAACLCLLVYAAQAEEFADEPAVQTFERSPLCAQLPVKGGSVEISAAEIEGETYLFLPAFADPKTLVLHIGEETPAWEQTEGEEGVVLHVSLKDGEELDVKVMQDSRLRTLFLISDDPLQEGREYIESSETHDTSAQAFMAMVDQQGQVAHAGEIRKLRGRGNGTWDHAKRPYQFKLEERMDLLDTGDPAEKNRTWVLLAEATDGTFLHNRLAFDLALELGLEETAHSEHVNLYYDGEYRGLYLLAEKPEIGEGRVDEQDYDKLIESWNESVGQHDLESLPVGRAENRYGAEFTYIENLQDSGAVDAGAYLVELENIKTLSDRCMFHLTDGSMYASKNPENASREMMIYLSERLEQARRTLRSGGFDEESGRRIEDDFDVDAFARTALVQELSCNLDGLLYSSTFFVLPAGETQFRPGPVWDFDLAWRTYSDGRNAHGYCLKDQNGWAENGWLNDFYASDDFVAVMQRICTEEFTPMIEEILLGEKQGRWLRPLDAYRQEISESVQMNEKLWQTVHDRRLVYGQSFEEEMELLRAFVQERSQRLHTLIAGARRDAERIDLWGSFVYGHTEGHVNGETLLEAAPWNHVRIRSHETEKLSEATEEAYALWQLEAVIEPEKGFAFENPSVTFNAVPISWEPANDGAIRIRVRFEDPSYRPVDYYGEDIGMIYNYDQYILNHPEVTELCGEDPEAVMDYFCDEGMYENHMGNAFFRPSDILAYHEELLSVLGEDWQMYYWDFLVYGYSDGWLLRNDKRYYPEVQDALVIPPAA